MTNFAYEIIKNVPFEILLASISNWHSFFTKRSFPAITHFLKCLILLDFFMYICIAFCIGHFYLSFLLFHFIFSGKRGYQHYSITHFFDYVRKLNNSVIYSSRSRISKISCLDRIHFMVLLAYTFRYSCSIFNK